MSFLSNSSSDRDAATTSAIVCRRAQADEVAAAIRFVLSSAQQKATDAQVVAFMQFALVRGIDTHAAYVAMDNGQMMAALLPVPTAGRTLLLVAAAFFPTPAHRECAARLVEHVFAEYTAAGTQLAQILFDPTEQEAIKLYQEHGFDPLAELIYLQTSTRRAQRAPELPPGYGWITYSPESHHLFARTIAATYQDSLDCPGLAVRRDIEDIVAGHRATGAFDPALWFVLAEEDRAVGVVLVAPAPPTESMELVYLGLIPSARGRHLGDLLLQHALYTAQRRNLPVLTLAVDSRNVPALQLYYRHGFRRVHSKMALIRMIEP